MIVIVVIGILAAITIVAYSGIASKAHEAALKSDLSNARTLLEIANSDNGSYPTDISQVNGGKGLPASNGTEYQYASDGTTYCLTAMSNTAGIPSYHLSSLDGTVRDNPCAGPNGGVVTTLAGSGTAGFADGTGIAAQLSNPSGVAIDSSGTVYVADSSNNCIRKITPSGVVTTLAGSGTAGSADGIGTAAQFNWPSGVAVDSAGTVYVADTSNSLIRKVTPGGVVTTWVGSTYGYAEGTGTTAQFKWPTGIAIDSAGTVYVADSTDNRIRKITPSGVVTTLAGSNFGGYADGTGAAAKFNQPSGVAVDFTGTVYVADHDSNRIRKITPGGVVTTLAGSGVWGSADGTGTATQFKYPSGVAVDSAGTIYVADDYDNRIRKITQSGVVTTLAGSTYGYADGTGTAAQFYSPYGIAVDSAGTVYVADDEGNRIRVIR